MNDKLKLWLKSKKIKKIQLARATGIHYVTILRILRGEQKPIFSTAKIISDFTGGEVTVQDIREIKNG